MTLAAHAPHLRHLQLHSVNVHHTVAREGSAARDLRERSSRPPGATQLTGTRRAPPPPLPPSHCGGLSLLLLPGHRGARRVARERACRRHTVAMARCARWQAWPGIDSRRRRRSACMLRSWARRRRHPPRCHAPRWLARRHRCRRRCCRLPDRRAAGSALEAGPPLGGKMPATGERGRRGEWGVAASGAWR